MIQKTTRSIRAQKRRNRPGLSGLFGSGEALRGLGLWGFSGGGFSGVFRLYLSSRKASKSGSKRGSWLSILLPLSECVRTIGGGLFAALRDSASDGSCPCLNCSNGVPCQRYVKLAPFLRGDVEVCGRVAEFCNTFLHASRCNCHEKRLRRLLNVDGKTFFIRSTCSRPPFRIVKRLRMCAL